MTRKAIVAGGSVGGLFAAAALRRAGWEAVVCERTEVELSGRGAGIVTHRALVEALEAVGAGSADLGVAVAERVAYDRAGAVVHRLDFPQVVTSWDRIHRLLRAVIPDGAHRLGRTVAGYEEDAEGVTVRFAEGGTERADLLVGADGFRSAVRAQMQPEVQPEYSGYVVWRALAPEAALSAAVRDEVFDAFGLYLPQGAQIIGYPIAGPQNDLRPGHRRYNFVWYTGVPEAALADMLTDAEGRRHALSIPPPLVRDELVAAMEAEARSRLPPAFAEILAASERPFFTPIYDLHAPVFGAGRVALVGDAACVARPHVGMGVTKAAEDALALARHAAAGPVAEATAAYSAERAPEARRAFERSRWLGAMIFEGDPAANPDGRSHPKRDAIMAETASADF